MDDDSLLRAFESKTLSLDEWNHRTHVRVAYLLATRHDFEKAMLLLRRGIKALNAHYNLPDGPLIGYNETTTMAFLTLIASTHQAYGTFFPTPGSEDFCDRHPHLLQKTVLRLFYSPERRGLPEAKISFVQPDLAPLPRIGGGWSSAR